MDCIASFEDPRRVLNRQGRVSEDGNDKKGNAVEKHEAKCLLAAESASIKHQAAIVHHDLDYEMAIDIYTSHITPPSL